MQEKVTVDIIVNGSQASEVLQNLKKQAKEFGEALYNAQQNNDAKVIEEYSKKLEEVEKEIEKIEKSIINVNEVMDRINEKKSYPYRTIGKIDQAYLWLKNYKNSISNKVKGLNIFDLYDEYSKLFSYYQKMNNNEVGNYEYKMKNSKIIKFSNKEDLKKILEDIQETIQTVSRLYDILEKITKNNPVEASRLANLYEINKEQEQSVANAMVEYITNKINDNEIKIKKLEAEYNANKKKINLPGTSENERHNLVMQNIKIEEEIQKIKNKSIQEDNEKKSKEVLAAKRKIIYEEYQKKYQELEEFYKEGQISEKTLIRKTKELRIEMYNELLKYSKKNSSEYFYFMRRQNEFIRQQAVNNIKEIENAIQAIINKYFNGSQSSNSITIGLKKYSLLSREELDENYKKSIEAIEVIEKRIKSNLNNDEKKLAKIQKYFDHAKRWEEINYKIAIGEDPTLNWKEKLEKFHNWFKEKETQDLINLANQAVAQISGIFSGIQSLIETDLEIRVAKLNKYYDTEISRAEGNQYIVRQLEKKRDKEISKARKEASDKTISFEIINAIAQNAQNILTAYGAGLQAPWPINMWLPEVMAGAAAVAGAVQLAVIYRQKQASLSTGYQKGGFTKKGKKDEPAGIVHAGEWIASQEIVNNPSTKPIIDALDYAQKTNTIGNFKIIEKYSSRKANQFEKQNLVIQSNDKALIKVLNQLDKKLELFSLENQLKKLNKRLDEPFVTINTVTGKYGIKKALDEYEKIQKNTLPKSKKNKIN